VDALVNIFASPAEMAEHAAWTLWEACAVAERVPVALSGGSTPALLYERLAEAYREEIPWERLEVFFGDERAVPPDHPHSNYRLAREKLLSLLPIPPAQVHRMPAEEPDLAAAARRYDELVRRKVPPGPGGLPQFHLVWLGMGEDGHVASLFPGTAALEEKTRLVAVGEAPAPGGRRLTFTLPLINAAQRVQLLISGRKKAKAVRRVLKPQKSEAGRAALPAARLRLRGGALEWLLDREAAAELERPLGPFLSAPSPL
jgi:6-phosphogluconolactonase